MPRNDIATPKKTRIDPLLTQQRSSARKSPSLRSVSDSNKARIHRVRFVDYKSSSICSLALSPASFDASKAFSHAQSTREILAVGRGNGNIEIHAWVGPDGQELSVRPGATKSQKQAWVVQSILPAHLPAGPVEHLVFAHQTMLSETDRNLLSSSAEIAEETKKLLETPPRLFSSSGSSTLFEWEWLSPGAGRHRATLQSEGGNIWSLACNPSGTSLAVGCEDGVIRLVSIIDGDFEIVRRLDKVNTRSLSLAWGPPASRDSLATDHKGKARATDDEASGQLADVYLVAGGADSTIRKWDLRSGRCISKMKTDEAGREATLVWTVAVLNDHTIISGDSMGMVKIWDGVMGVQRQSHKSHKADVLCMAVAEHERIIYTSGIDQMTVQISLISADKSQPPDTTSVAKWVITSTRRLHTHDVRAMVHSPAAVRTVKNPQGRRVPILLSGGIDMALVLTPAAPAGSAAYAQALSKLSNPLGDSSATVFDHSLQRKLPYVPQRHRAVHLAREARLLLSQSDTSLAIWRLPGVGSSAGSLMEESDDGWHKCCEISLNCATHLTVSAISPDGRWLAVSDRYEAKLFALTPQLDGSIEVKRVKAFGLLFEQHATLSRDCAASAFVFTPDSRRLVLSSLTLSQLVVIRLPLADVKQECEIIKIFSQHAVSVSPGRALAGSISVNGVANGKKAANGQAGTEGDSDSEDDAAFQPSKTVAAIACLAVSDDNQWLASADAAKRLHVFHLDSLQHHCALPSPDLPPSALAFIPLAPSNLVVGLPNNTIQVFDVESRRVASWAKSLTVEPIKQLYDLYDPLLGLSMEPLHAKGSSSTSASPLPSPMGVRTTPLAFGSSSPAPRPRIPIMVIWGATWLCRVRLTCAMPASSTPRGLKRSSAQVAGAGDSSGSEEQAPSTIRDEDVQVSHKYQPLLALGFLAPGELVAVERPAITMLFEMPPAFQASGRYGT